MMLITHATNFLSSQLMRTLNQHNFNYLVAVDDIPSHPFPLPTRHVQQFLTNYLLPDWLHEHSSEVEFMFHLDTNAVTPSDTLFHSLWEYAINHQIPFIFRTTPARTAWVAQQTTTPFFWAGLSFSDAFGPGDNGWVPQAYQALSQEAPAPHPSETRSLVYSPDIAAACYFLLHHRTNAGMHALTTEATTNYEQVIGWVSDATKKGSPIEPTASAPTSLRTRGFDQPFFSPEAGVYDYVLNHLMG